MSWVMDPNTNPRGYSLASIRYNRVALVTFWAVLRRFGLGLKPVKLYDPRAERWRQLLADAMHDAGISQSELARRIGRKAAQVNQWLNAGDRYAPPEPDVVFAIEDVLGCPDRLSSALGYVRPGSVSDVERAIRVDPRLSKAERQTLLDLWRVLVERGG